MKKIFAAMFLALIFATAPVQAQTNFDFNQNFNEKIQPLSYIYGGRVVGIKTFLSISFETALAFVLFIFQEAR